MIQGFMKRRESRIRRRGNRTELHRASIDGDEKRILQLLRAGEDAFARDKQGRTALHLAIIYGKLRAAQALIDLKPNLANVKYHDEITTLTLAIIKGRGNIVYELIKSNPDQTNVKTDSGRTPFHYAASLGSFNMVELLLNFGADPCIADKKGYTPLHWAVLNGNLDAVLAISSRKPACLRMKTFDLGFTPLSLAIVLRNKDAAMMLMHADPSTLDITDDSQYTPLHLAAMLEDTQVTKMLLFFGADPNAKCAGGLTPLHLNVIFRKWKGKKSLIEYVIQYLGENIDTPNSSEEKRNLEFFENEIYECLKRSLVSYHTNGQFHILPTLIMEGGDFFAENDAGKTPMNLLALGMMAHKFVTVNKKQTKLNDDMKKENNEHSH